MGALFDEELFNSQSFLASSSGLLPPDRFTVVGGNDSGTTRTFVAEVYCITASG